jgi:hypothetical protein
VILQIATFGGIAPKLDPSVLPDHGAQEAADTKMQRGILGVWRKPLALVPPVAAVGAKTIFFDQGTSTWLSWTTDVDIHPGPVADLSAAYRYYLTGDGVPKKFDSAGGKAAWLHMGVPAPAAAAAASGGSGALTRVYVYTNVSVFSGIEEESAPSPPTTITNWASGNTITLSSMSAVPGANYNVTKRRLYRSNGTAYLFVKEFTGTSTTEAITDANLGEGLSSLDYDPPPTGLTGLTPMANGFFAGFVGNELYFSQPYQPHAWPTRYSLTTNEQIVALRAVPQGLYVMTTGIPYFCSGAYPDSMTLERAQEYAPCLSKRSVASDGSGAMYVTYNGVAYLQGAAVNSLSQSLFSQEEWGAYRPSSMMGIYHDNRYFLWYDNGATQAGLVFDKTLQTAPLTTSREYATAARVSPVDGTLAIVSAGAIKTLDADPINRTPFDWKSKLFITPKPTNFSFAQVQLEAVVVTEAAAAAAANAALWAVGGYAAGFNDHDVNTYEVNGSAIQSIPTVDNRYTTLQVYADGNLVAVRDILDESLLRLPSGFKGTRWEVRVLSNRPVRRITLATSATEIAAQ